MLWCCYVFKTQNVTKEKRKKSNEIKGLEKKKFVMLYKYEILRIIYKAFLEYIEVRIALVEKLCRFTRHTLTQKNVTRNIALKSTTYAKINVTLGVTLLHGNITFVRLRLVLPPHRELVQGT